MKRIRMTLKNGDDLDIFYDDIFFNMWIVNNITQDDWDSFGSLKLACNSLNPEDVKNITMKIKYRDELYFDDGQKVHKAGTFHFQPYMINNKISFFWQFVDTRKNELANENLAHRREGLESMFALIDMVQNVFWVDKNLRKLVAKTK